jgi:hypothetical protein
MLRDASPSLAARRRGHGAASVCAPFMVAGASLAAVGASWALVGDAGYWKDPISARPHGRLARRRAARRGSSARRRACVALGAPPSRS